METMNNDNHLNNSKERERERERAELDKVLKRRDRERFLREIADLERQEAFCWSSILWSTISFLIIEPIGATIAIWYLWDQFINSFAQGVIIQNLGSNVKWTAIGIAGAFALTSLNIIYHLWRVSSLKKQITRVREEIARLI